MTKSKFNFFQTQFIFNRLIEAHLRLKKPSDCLFGPRYGSVCAFCTNETVKNHGITSFSKVRLNITTLTIIGKFYKHPILKFMGNLFLFENKIENDFSFANVKYGSPVPFGNAGDCYSSDHNCQQV